MSRVIWARTKSYEQNDLGKETRKIYERIRRSDNDALVNAERAFLGLPPLDRLHVSVQPPPKSSGDQNYGGYGGDLPPMNSGGPGLHHEFPCVKLRGLPFDATEEDVRMFLALDPLDILLVRQNGRLTGEAYVLLTALVHVDLSLAKNKSYIGRRYVEVFRARKADYYRAVCAEVIDAGGGPPSHHGYGGGHSSHHDYDRRDHHRERDRERERDRHGGGGGGGGYTAQDIGDTTILKLRGLPFSVQDEDIVRWFDEPALGVSPLNSDSVFIVQEGGRPSGIAFVEFASNQEAQAAMAKNKQTMGNRYIEIFPANRSDLERFRARG